MKTIVDEGLVKKSFFIDFILPQRQRRVSELILDQYHWQHELYLTVCESQTNKFTDCKSFHWATTDVDSNSKSSFKWFSPDFLLLFRSSVA